MITDVDMMSIAIAEAETSLREENCGFGAVVVKSGQIVSQAHDTEKTDGDPTAHAEMAAIRKAAQVLGRDLAGCQIFSTHEPCPMCSTAILWAHIDSVSYGYSISEAICRILGLDTRFVCKHFSEKPTAAMLREIDPRLRFSRKYSTLRPYGEFCEETISMQER